MSLLPVKNGRVALNSSENTATDQYLGGIRFSTTGEVKATTATGTFFNQGIPMSESGQVSFVDATAGLPANTIYHNGLPISSDKVCISYNPATVVSSGIPFDANGAVAAELMTLNLQFAGATALDSNVTFTRASTATYVGSTGLIQSAANDVPRFDYAPATLAAKGLLIEESRQNLHLYSQDFGVNWTTAVATDCAITAAAATSPDGTTNAGSFLCTTTASVSRRVYAAANITLATSSVYSASIYVKALNWTWIGVALAAGTAYTTVPAAGRVNLSTGATTLQIGASITATNAGNGWWRITVVGTTDATITSYRLSVALLDGDFSIVTASTGVIGAGVYVYGAQIELGAFPTSYIPTTTTALTRATDVAQVNTLSPWFNATEGTLYAQATVPSVVLANRVMSSLTQTVSAAQDIILLISRSADSRRLASISNATTQFSYAPAGAVTSSKGALAYKANDSQTAFDGVASATDTLVTLPVSTARLHIGNSDGGADNLNGHIQRITYYPRRLSEAELIAITA